MKVFLFKKASSAHSKPFIYLFSNVWGVRKLIWTKIRKSGEHNLEKCFKNAKRNQKYDAKNVRKLVEGRWVKKQFIEVLVEKLLK